MNQNSPFVAIVGMACVYPDARTPVELWENVLAQRRAFRRLPTERLCAEDYWSADHNAPDRTYAIEGAVIEGYEFDRVGFRVAGSTYRSADLTHWLALDVAAKALADAGFPEGRGLPRESTGVRLGNTLTGEFSRASVLRLRWPYVRRTVAAALAKEDWSAETRAAFLNRLEASYKAPFAPVGEETLAGGLSNTIAGRICNHFDLKGGGFTVDGACASSLLAVADACSALVAGDLDVALAGGVDLSLDPFELVGFAKTGALAAEEMRVFDQRSQGFWPGEGCGFVTLMRQEDALAQGCRVYAVIRGWGISSDGSGGITRPEAWGQIEALRRAYRRAGFGIDTVTYCEGHGTGTAVGDATELEVLSSARREAKPGAPPAVVGSIKANIGHTKAAAGVAGLIKATMAVHTQVLPPTTGCGQPHAHLRGAGAVLRVLREAEPWPEGRPLRASVSAMGFGGINVHLALESPAPQQRSSLSPRERSLARSYQDAELFLFAAESASALVAEVDRLLPLAARLSRAELLDLAAQLQKGCGAGVCRAAVVASRPVELEERLRTLRSWLVAERVGRFRSAEGVFLGSGHKLPRIVFLFPGQGSPAHLDGGLWRHRFDSVRELYARAALPQNGDTTSTQVMQPAVVAASLAGLAVLDEFGLLANAAIGHSLGELTALRWGGVLSEDALLRVARTRGAAMAQLGSPTGAMLAVAAPWPKVQALLNADPVTIVGFNSPRQTVVAGDAEALRRLAQRARAADCEATLLPVSHAFHTSLVAAAVPALAQALGRESFAPLKRPVFSTITGKALAANEDFRALLCRQVTAPVRFQNALEELLGVKGDERQMAGVCARSRVSGVRSSSGAVTSDPTGTCESTNVPSASDVAAPEDGRTPPASAAAHADAVDLLVEVGPGSVLAGLARAITDVPAISLDAAGHSLTGLLQALGAAFALGEPIHTGLLFSDRFTRPFALDWKPRFFVNPCELAPVSEGRSMKGEGREARDNARSAEREPHSKATPVRPADGKQPPLELVRQLVAQRAELPLTAVRDEHRMLNDLHLNSISVGQLVSEAARRLSLPRVVSLTDFANASVAEMARALEVLQQTGGARKKDDHRQQPPGVDIWFQRFTIELVEAPRTPITRARRAGSGERISAQACSAPPNWQIFAPRNHPLAAPLEEKLAKVSGGEVVLCLPERPDEGDVALWLAAAHAVMATKPQPRFVLVQYGWGAAGFARTLYLETPGLAVCVVNVPPGCVKAADWIVAEAQVASGYTEAHYDSRGTRRVPRLNLVQPDTREEPLEPAETGKLPLGSADVLLVTGGGKGIAAECALALGRACGTRLALLGRSAPEADGELEANLARFAAAGLRCCYVRADVTDAAAVRQAVAEAERQLGPVTALLHGAGANSPQLLETLSEAAFRRTLAPKIQGARNVLAALDADRLKLFITFGSIIARAGLRGEADYATANEWLTALTEEFQTTHAHCRCLALEWSLWAEVGMGERLGRVESLIQQGIMPIPPDEGVRLLLECLRQPASSVAQVITGRFGQTDTLKLAQPELPLRRFLERKRVHYPGVELVVDAELSLDADPYLKDHVVQRENLLPAVLGLEAMAQAAMALSGGDSLPVFEAVELPRPVVVPPKGPVTIRLAALLRGPGLVEVCLRSEETDFHVDHFRALCRFGMPDRESLPRLALSWAIPEPPRLDPEEALYGSILFHQGRFCRLRGYQLLKAKECVAEILPDDPHPWFGPYLPAGFVLGHPAARDACLHAIQACIPHQRILPTGIERLVIRRTGSGPRLVRAKERWHEGNDFIYDLEVTDESGELLETWQGLRLRAVGPLPPPETWPEALVGPYLERRLGEIMPGSSAKVAFHQHSQSLVGTRSTASLISREYGDAVERVPTTDSVLQHALGRLEPIRRRPDGKPETAADLGLSAAHARAFTLAIAGPPGVACDLETVTARAQTVWRDLLGDERLAVAEQVAREQAETLDTAATRLWTVSECCKKAGLPAGAPVVLEPGSADGWVVFRSGTFLIATVLLRVQAGALVAAVAVPSGAPKRRQPAVAEANG